MRPDILNPLFAEVEVLKGIGPALGRPLHRLKLDRVVDILFHLPTGWIDRKKVERLDEADVGRTITVELTARDYRQSGGRGPFRIFAQDAGGDYVTLTYFNNPGWGKKQLPIGEALETAHRDPAAAKARERLAYDEVFANQLALNLVRASSRRRKGVPLKGDGRLRDRLKLPYAPTSAQRGAVAEIEGDLQQEVPMLRLLQGDVGSGKTLVALMAMLAAVEAGAQAALLAPTEILARQHYDTLSRQLSGLGVNVAILTGREKGRARESCLMSLADGSIDILVVTHAIFQQAVAYKRLGLAVVDEQHRFGVAQRMMLAAK